MDIFSFLYEANIFLEFYLRSKTLGGWGGGGRDHETKYSRIVIEKCVRPFSLNIGMSMADRIEYRKKLLEASASQSTPLLF